MKCFKNFWKRSITQIDITRDDLHAIHIVIQGPIFFGITYKLEHLLSSMHVEPSDIVLFQFQDVPFIDVTGLTVLSKIAQQLHAQGHTIYVEHANDGIKRKIKKMNIDQFMKIL